MNKTVRNERRKLRATWYNNASLAMIVAGFLTPFWAIIYGTAQVKGEDDTRAVAFVICVTIGVLLRYLADMTLGSLEE